MDRSKEEKLAAALVLSAAQLEAPKMSPRQREAYQKWYTRSGSLNSKENELLRPILFHQLPPK